MTTKQRNRKSSDITLSSYPRNRMTSRAIVWIVGNSWWILGLLILLLVSFEAYDFTHPHSKSLYIVESVIYVILVGIIVLLLISLGRGIRNQVRIIRVLDAKHALSLELSGIQGWDELVEQIAKFPGSLAPAVQACFFISNAITNQFELAAQWSIMGKYESNLCSEAACQDCIEAGRTADLTFKQCLPDPLAGGPSDQPKKYCLPIKDKESLLGILHFTLEAGKSLTDEEVDIFRNIGVDIAVALKAGQDRKVLSELRISETALAERRSVSHYLHDHLGQSLGFLHLKMDQLLTEKDELSLERVLDDLELMRGAAFESYEIVRGILETIHPETTRTLSNLLMEYARKISRRSDIAIDFKIKGSPVILPEETQKAVFYAFEESLSNVEKHSQATRVTILAEWMPDNFELTISDNGVGFNPQDVNTDRHFGMEILNERMATVNGRITLITMENSGTVVDIHVPSTFQGQLGAGI